MSEHMQVLISMVYHYRGTCICSLTNRSTQVYSASFQYIQALTPRLLNPIPYTYIQLLHAGDVEGVWRCSVEALNYSH